VLVQYLILIDLMFVDAGKVYIKDELGVRSLIMLGLIPNISECTRLR